MHQIRVSPRQARLFFTDSGQQAINLPMLVYGHMYKQSDTDKPVYNFTEKPTPDIIDEFQSVSDEAMTPYLATALTMFN